MSDEIKPDGVELADLSEEAANADASNSQEAIADSQVKDPSETLTKRVEPDGASASKTQGADETSPVIPELEAVFDVPVGVAAVLGRTNIEVSNLLALNEGDVVELDRKVGEAIDIFINNRLIARGEVVLVEDRLGVTMTEIIKGDQAA